MLQLCFTKLYSIKMLYTEHFSRIITVKGVLFNQARTLQFTEICILSATVFGILEMNLLFIYSYI